MLEYLLDSGKNLKAVIDFWIVDKFGKLDDNGKYIWVQYYYVNPSCRNNGVMSGFIDKIIQRVPWAEYGYFKREKGNTERIKMFSKKKWLRISKMFK